MNSTPAKNYHCVICGNHSASPKPDELGVVRGNTERYKNSLFHLWKCPKCSSIHSVDPVDFEDIYRDYPLNKRKLDIYARGTLGNLIRRLEKAGIKRSDRIMDFGCGNGIFIDFLKQCGFQNISGYDPFVPEFSTSPPNDVRFDCVIANDVVEHVPDPRQTVRDCAALLRSGGLLYLGTADSDGVEMRDLEPHVMRMHQPFHRVIINQQSLRKLGVDVGLEPVVDYRRSYMDTKVPFANYRFLDELSKALGHNLDTMLDPNSGTIVARKPILLFYGLFGYYFPSAYEPAIIFKKA